MNDQVENVLGHHRFGRTTALPSGETLLALMGFLYRLAEWEPKRHMLRASVVHDQVERMPGVYMLWLKPPSPYKGGEAYNHSTRLAYIGKAKNLQLRLAGYTSAVNPDRPPVYQVVRDQVMGNPQLAHDYLISTPSQMRATRRAWMAERCLSFEVAYTENERAAFDLEATMIRYCDSHNIELWNSTMYTTGVTWPRPRSA